MNNSIVINGETCFPYIHNNNYYISRTGKIYSTYVKGGNGSVNITKPHLLRYGIDKDGYYRVVLCTNNVKRYIKVHTVIVQQFIGDIPNNMVVNHIDGNKQNNCVENLEITTVLENTRHAHKHGLCSQDHKLKVIYDNKEFEFSSKIECVRQFKIPLHYLTQIEKGIITYRMILFKVSDNGGIDAFYNGTFYKHFNMMKDADDYFHMSRGTTSEAVKNSKIIGSYREFINRYKVIFP